MSVGLLEPVELRARGFEALVNSLGWVNAVRFIHQYESGQLNYTAERSQILPDWDAAEMLRRLQAADLSAASTTPSQRATTSGS